MKVFAENRLMHPTAEDRSMVALREPRAMAAEVKAAITTTEITVRFEPRAMSAGPRKRVC